MNDVEQFKSGKSLFVVRDGEYLYSYFTDELGYIQKYEYLNDKPLYCGIVWGQSINELIDIYPQGVFTSNIKFYSMSYRC